MSVLPPGASEAFYAISAQIRDGQDRLSALREELGALASREMTTAIQNAERLANALERLRATGHAAMKFDFTEAGGAELPHEL